MSVTYHLSGGLSDGQLRQCRDLAVSILMEIGLDIDHAEIRGFLGRCEGVRIRDKRVCYSEELFERCLREQGEQNSDYVYQRPGEAEFVMRPAYLCLNVHDPVRAETRRATTEDLVRAVKLCDSYGMAGPPPLHPQDLPVEQRQVALVKTCIENGRAVGGWALARNVEDIRCITEMSRLAGRVPPYVALQIPISPLRLNAECLDILWRLRGTPDLACGIAAGGGAIPMLGATAPLRLPAAWAQATAEAAVGYITAKLVNEHVLAYASFQVFPFDMRTASIRIGSPEGALARLGGKQILRGLFGRAAGSALSSSGVPLSAQSTAERMANVLLDALAGSRVFYDAGMNALDDLFCPEQVVVDHEILRWVQWVLRGLELCGERAVVLDALREGIAEGTFLMQQWTLDHREYCWEPGVFDYGSLARPSEPRQTLAERARETVNHRISAHAFSLPAGVAREINRVYGKASQRLRSCS